MNTIDTIIKFFQTGGIFMYPIVLVLALGAAIAIERYIYLSRARVSNRKVWTTIQPLLKKGDLTQTAKVLSKSGTAIGRILFYGLSRNTSERRRDDTGTAR